MLVASVLCMVATVFGAAVGGFLLGRGARKVGPLCGCGHNWGSHEDGGGCGAEIRQRLPLFDGFQWVSCPCRRYDGPLPMGAVWPGVV